jgi:hypothetical protein
MSLLGYEHQLSNLKVNKVGGREEIKVAVSEPVA